MIYYREEPVEIIGSVGEVAVPGLEIKLVLLKCRSLEEKGSIIWIFREYMRADGDLIEIIETSKNAPKLEISEDELQRAITKARYS